MGVEVDLALAKRPPHRYNAIQIQHIVWLMRWCISSLVVVYSAVTQGTGREWRKHLTPGPIRQVWTCIPRHPVSPKLSPVPPNQQ